MKGAINSNEKGDEEQCKGVRRQLAYYIIARYNIYYAYS
jgi:hypothetical protein